MNPHAPSKTLNASLKQVATFFGFSTRRLAQVAASLGVVPWSSGGEARFGECHVVAIALGIADSKSQIADGRADEVRQAWRRFCGMPAVDGPELADLLAQHKNLLSSVHHYEQRCLKLEKEIIPAMQAQIDVLKRQRGPKPSITEELEKLDVVMSATRKHLSGVAA